MGNIMSKKDFQAFIKVLHILAKLLFTVWSIGLSLLVIALAIIGVIPNEKIIEFLNKGELQAGLNFAGIHIRLSDQVVSNIQFVKGPMLILLAFVTFYSILTLIIIYCVQSMLKGIRNNEVFTLKNSKYIEWIAYSIILMSFILQPIQLMTFFAFDELFQLSSFIKNSDWIQSMSYDYFNIHWSLLFSGIIIWVIGRSFKYGAFLQEEFDATL